jgi:hypothetical protein
MVALNWPDLPIECQSGSTAQAHVSNLVVVGSGLTQAAGAGCCSAWRHAEYTQQLLTLGSRTSAVAGVPAHHAVRRLVRSASTNPPQIPCRPTVSH